MTAPAIDVRESTRYCRNVTRRAATSFYYAFKTLPRRKRIAFEVVYAFMRLSDDLSDEAALDGKDERIAEWRRLLHRALDGDVDVHPVMPALMKTIEEFAIPTSLFDELIDGTEQDLTITRYPDFESLYGYCYQVASVVGLVSLRIFELREPSAESWQRADEIGIACGLAFQLTNILRDIKEDIERDRIYLPADELARFGITEDDLRGPPDRERIREFMVFQTQRAESFYEASAALPDLLPADARPCLLTMRGIYHGILEKIVELDYDVWSVRARVPLARKLGIAARAFLGRFGS